MVTLDELWIRNGSSAVSLELNATDITLARGVKKHSCGIIHAVILNNKHTRWRKYPRLWIPYGTMPACTASLMFWTVCSSRCLAVTRSSIGRWCNKMSSHPAAPAFVMV